jgi:hypothetical protein
MHQAQHDFFKPDIFGFQGQTLSKEIEIILSLRAYLIKRRLPLEYTFY